jgi:F-type H+-transporting ATPase subunit b
MNIQIDLVLTQILGFVLFVWILRKLMWGPVMDMLDQRRHKIAADFREAEKRQADADALKAQYESELRGIETRARARMQEAIGEGQQVAAEIRAQATEEASQRIHHAEESIAREVEKSKELLKEQMAALSLRAAEKVMRERLDEARHRQLIELFIEELGQMKAR